jgi:hypothetical protein
MKAGRVVLTAASCPGRTLRTKASQKIPAEIVATSCRNNLQKSLHFDLYFLIPSLPDNVTIGISMFLNCTTVCHCSVQLEENPETQNSFSTGV